MIKKICLVLMIGLVGPFSLPGSEKSLRILFCMRRFPTNTAWFILNQMVKFIEQGHEVSIYTTNFDRNSININHPDIIKYNLLDRVFTSIPEQKDFDILLCQSAFLAPHIIELKEQNKLSGKLVMFVREAFKGELLPMRRWIFDNVDLVMPVCEYFKNQLIEFGCNENKIIVLHSAIDINKFYFKERLRKKGEPIKLVTTSRLNEKKGIHYAIQAISSLIKKYPTLQYTVMGDGQYKYKLLALIEKLHLKHNVHLVGWKTPTEVVKKLSKSHIFVLPSAKSSGGHEEGIPNALMEACAMGLPVVSTYHAGIPELVKDGVSGFLVPERNVKMLADRLENLILCPELWSSMGRAGREIVEKNFNRDIENRRLITICCDLAHKEVRELSEESISK